MNYQQIVLNQLNPLRKTITYYGDAEAPVLYKYDSSGFISPSTNRNVTIQDGAYINEYNQRVATRLQEQDNTLNQFLRQSMPNWQPPNNDLGVLANPTVNYSNEGRNYQTPTYNFSPNYRGNGFTDPRILDNSGGYRGMNTYSGVYASQAAENAAFEQDWNTAINAYSMQPSYTSFPTDPAAYNGYSDAFGDNPSGHPTSNSPGPVGGGWGSNPGIPTDPGYPEDPGYPTDPGYPEDPGYPTDDGGEWYPLVIDLDGDGVEIKPLDRSTTTFDIDSDGYKERTAWAGADDGMLVIDLNGDGQITQSKEMAFGEWTTEQDTDLQALAKVFDSNDVADVGAAANDVLYRRWANV